ncbi:lysylphosphatidylglycerol synthase transmembrane domain-containing protein [Teredinibacter sp. KSP-S5-2]|uniref:lysylphosphatidylglycerol synthase transmembrane domain-containing protein n=1 Tax=Teredinibacter sp. KSP-S5-2 TaxID=3034506 RepID=UPI0029351101|nr:lysylphosphatidylglycerol synthase transmembrane domain-containing protein [Teredinibacter sp. KSP-S5-2]WNO11208.1 lysylphosphatidylglycerol synthase transmembrane domain-containing protein [Teredinibacter sp. KSP-S5-2]
MSQTGKVLFKSIFALAVLAAVIVWVELEYTWQATLVAWSKLGLIATLLAICLVLTSHLLRVARIYFAYNRRGQVAFKRVMAVSLVHNTVSYLLPMRLGEAALPTLSKYQLDVELRYSLATLLLIRLFDAHVLLLLLSFFAGSIWLGKHAVWGPIVLILALPTVMTLMKTAGDRLPKLSFAQPLYANTSSWVSLYAITLAIWLVKLFALAYVASILGDLPIDHAWLATIIADGSALSPITGIANSGTFEFAFALPLVPLGYEMETLVKAAVNLHIFIFFINMAAGAFGAMFLQRKTGT